jgi:carbamoyl-phosphate synthase large subunit
MYPNIRIVGLSYDPLESGLYSHGVDHVDAAYSIAFPTNGPDPLRARLKDIQKTERIDAIIPTLDSELDNFVALVPFFEANGIKTMLPSKNAIKQRSKAKLAEFCEEKHIHCPKTKTGYDAFTLTSAVPELGGYPVFLKGPLYEGQLVNDAKELTEFASHLLQRWGGPVLVQQAVVGEEYCFTGVVDDTGELLGQCAIRKLLVTKAGKGFAGIVISDADLERAARRILSELAWTGPFELEFVKPLRGPHMLLEINPRFPAWIDFPSQIGCNLPGLLLDHVFGVKSPEQAACPAGRIFVRHSVDLVGDIEDVARLVTQGSMLAHIGATGLERAE